MGIFAERLAEVVRRQGPLCVGIDPRWELLPRAWRGPLRPEGDPLQQAAAVVGRFAGRVCELVRPYCGVIKLQAAFFELFGPAGLAAMQQTLALARQMGYVTILDAKRGDIASTAEAYAAAAFAGCTLDGVTCPVWDADALTVQPYLGADAVEPFVRLARQHGRGLFVLVRTSNAGAGLFQDQPCGGKPLYHHVAQAVAEWNAPTVGPCGLGDVGAVAGATHPRELAEIRRLWPQLWLLVPGYGVQGAAAADVQAAFRPDGLGAIVNSSRGVVFPFHPDDPQWEAAVIAAARRGAEELRPARRGSG